MEWKFGKETLSFLDMSLCEVLSSDQSQELRLPDELPDVGRVVAAWGQGILRSKQWSGDQISVSAGLLVWVLYAPEDGSPEQVIEGWLPVQLHWDLPEPVPEGEIRVRLQPRFVEARALSPRKLTVRAGISAALQALSPKTVDICAPETPVQQLELLESTYPMELYREAGEKEFSMEEQWQLPDAAPHPARLIYAQLRPEVTETKLLGNKLVFRGTAKVHILYRSEEGQLYGWDFSPGISQYAQLDREYGQEARADVMLMPTALEIGVDDEGMVNLKGSVTAQYAVSDRTMVTLVHDAYAPGWELELSHTRIQIPAILERRRESVLLQSAVNADANIVVDAQLWTEYPRQRRSQSGVELQIPGQCQLLYYGSDGKLHGSTVKAEGQWHLDADTASTFQVLTGETSLQTAIENERIPLRAEVPLEITAAGSGAMDMLTQVSTGQPRAADPNRPSLVLRRAAGDSLWSLARENGSTVEAIRRANGLTGEAPPEQMLLIPVL